MTKADLVKSIHLKTGFSVSETHNIVDQIFELMKQSLGKGEQVKISGFGNFTVKSKNVRKGRNPQTGEEIELPGRKVLGFKASHLLTRKMNG